LGQLVRGGSIVRVFGNSELNFSVKNFLIADKNKVQIFACRISERFLVSSPLAGSKDRWC
jgi:hypothetical protein